MMTEISATCTLSAATQRRVVDALKDAIIRTSTPGSLQGVVLGGKFAGVDQSMHGIAVVTTQYKLRHFKFRLDRVHVWFRSKKFPLDV